MFQKRYDVFVSFRVWSRDPERAKLEIIDALNLNTIGIDYEVEGVTDIALNPQIVEDKGNG